MGCKQTKRPSKPPDPTISIRAAILIQRWHRRHLARVKMRELYTWRIFQKMEYASEQDQIELFKFFNALMEHFGDQKSIIHQPSVSSINVNAGRYDDSGAEQSSNVKDYRGPNLKFPLSKSDIDLLINTFRLKSSGHLHHSYVVQILKEAQHKLQSLPNFYMVSTLVSKKVTVVGDLHGKFEDLLVIFHKNGLPSIDNPYIFNGDFVDRGKQGLEVFLLLLACFMAFPNSVFLNRGNHEDTVMNSRYGFLAEVGTKYKRHSDQLISLIEDVYRFLPLGSIINAKVFVVHGGISDTTSLDILRKMDRSKFISILRPPVSASHTQQDFLEWRQLFDIMWSDPQSADGCIPNSLRGAGTYFGPDVTRNFLKKNKLLYIIRSHECKRDGYEFTHNDQIITIFSASNYYAPGSNRGAFIRLNTQLAPHFIQYISQVARTNKYTFEQKVGLVESAALRELAARLREKRGDLTREFQKYDPNNTGIITVSEWCEAMEHATGFGLPWRILREHLAPMPKDWKSSNDVNYNSTLELLNADVIVQEYKANVSVAESLYINRSSLVQIFNILDKDNSGTISLEEFSDACDLMERHLRGGTTKAELMKMCRLMDINGDGLVDINEFLEAFRLCYNTMQTRRRGDSKNYASTSEYESFPDDTKSNAAASPSRSQLPSTSRQNESVARAARRLDRPQIDSGSEIDMSDAEIQNLDSQDQNVLGFVKKSKKDGPP